MAITSDYNQANMQKLLESEQEIGYITLLVDMIDVCMSFVEDAKNQPEGHELGFYNNITGDLRASIGAYIFRDGRLIWSMSEGNEDENLRIIVDESDGRIVDKGFTAVGIAGMMYASYVQSKGYNVINSQSDYCLLDLTNLFNSKKW